MMHALTSNSIQRNVARHVARFSVALLLALTLHITPATVSQAEASNASLQTMQQEATERAERRRPIMVLFPAGVALLTLVLVLTVKRRR